jgi:phosphatidylglycerol:prolipoprotein diacylglycerol transferase
MFLLAESYLHQLDPFVIRFTESFGLRWYGLAYVAGFVVAWLMIRWMAKTRRSLLTPVEVGDLLVYVVLGVLLGGRLGHAIFYGGGQPFITFTDSFPYWEILAIHRGGMSAHGGMIGVIIACTIFKWRRNISALHLVDLAALAACPGLFFGRIANFINAELWGKALPPQAQRDPPWWSIKYPQEVTEVWLPLSTQDHYTGMGSAPEAAIEATRKLQDLQHVLGDRIEQDLQFFPRIVNIALDSSHALHTEVVATLRPMLTAYHPSQIIQAISDGPILMGLLLLIWLRPRKPGVVGSWFLILYGVLRTLTEVFRQPDEGVALLMGLSRGQLLSVLMTAAGFVCLWIAVKRQGEPILGLGKKRIPAVQNEPRP